MSSQTSLVAEQVRLQQWAAQIQDCKNRPADMKVETWCSEHGITKANYYYRLKRVRKACLEVYNPEPAFVELPQPTEKALPREDSSLKPTAILRNSRGLALEIYNPVSKDMLATVYKGNIIKNLIMDCQSYTKYRPNETTGRIFVSWRRKEELPTGA